MALPQVGAMGVCVIKEPFTLPDGEIAKIAGVDSFEALGFRGVDVKATHYLAHGLSESDYVRDHDNDPYIVTLIINGTQQPMFVPSSYFTSYPDVNATVAYSDVALVLKLGLLPDGLQMAGLLATIAEETKNAIGVTVEPEVLHLPVKGGISYQESVEMELARSTQMTSQVRTGDLLSKLQVAFDDQLTYINALEEVITQNG